VVEHLTELLTSQLALMQAAVQVLEESRSRVAVFADRLGSDLTVSERESCEALTSRFARLNDFLLQRVFRTLDQVELADEGTGLDRLQRAEARGLISSAERWRELRLLRNAIAHDYLIESADRVLRESLATAPELIETAERVGSYVATKGYCDAKSKARAFFFCWTQPRHVAIMNRRSFVQLLIPLTTEADHDQNHCRRRRAVNA